ncbi:MAG: hypothetical protein WCS80_02245 [Bacilli bacterium]
MKDRIIRTNHKKASHRLRNAALSVLAFSIVGCTAMAFVLAHYTTENERLSRSINEYTVQVDLIETKNNIFKNSENGK